MTIEMMLNEDGVVVDKDGKPIMLGEDDMKIPGMQSQDQVNATVQERLARQKTSLAELKKIADRTPALQATIDDLQTDLDEAQKGQKDAEVVAAQRVKTQLDEAKAQTTGLEKALADERVGRMHDNIATQVLALAGDFVNPAADLVPKMRGAHSQEPVLGDDGKPTGDMVHRFELSFPDPEKEGATKTEKLPLNEAVEVMKGLFPHYVKGKASGGSGGSKFLKGPRTITSHDQLTTDAERSAYISEYGMPAFQELSKKPAG